MVDDSNPYINPYEEPLNNDTLPHNYSDKYSITHFTLASLYLLLLVFITADRFIDLYKRKRSKLSFWKLTFRISLLVGCLARVIGMALQPFVYHRHMKIPNQLNNILVLFPSFIFFSCYLIILFQFTGFYFTMYSYSKSWLKRLRTIYLIVNGCMYAVVIGCFTVDCIVYPLSKDNVATATTTVEKLLVAFAGCVYCLAAIVISLFGILLYVKYFSKQSVTVQSAMSKTMFRLQVLICFLVALWFLRGIWTLYAVFSSTTVFGSRSWWVDLLYYGVFEGLVIVMMLFMLRPLGKEKTLSGNDETSPINGDGSTQYGYYYNSEDSDDYNSY
mmetsp:Transcript_17167/g.19138  ORF Transcript_17167/g.19138 Transcript_17167/m.19138 type:complete len:330 (-) Transcript_17167:60-1049(-)